MKIASDNLSDEQLDDVFACEGMSRSEIRQLKREIDFWKCDRNALAHVGNKDLKNFVGEEVGRCMDLASMNKNMSVFPMVWQNQKCNGFPRIL